MGRTGLRISRLCLGTMNFGPNTDEAEAFRIMDMALDAGINFFDTANMYGDREGKRRGLTEEIIGRWFSKGGGRRQRTVLATKVFESMYSGLDGPNDEPGLSAYKIRRHLKASLERLQTDHIELYYLHNPDPHAGWEELWGVLQPLAEQGVIDYIGCSNFAAYQIAIAQSEAAKHRFLGFAADQTRYDLLSRYPEAELIPCCRELGLGFMCWGPLHGGLLSGSLFREMGEKQRSNKFAGRIDPKVYDRLKLYHELCQGYGISEAAASMLWLLERPGVSSVLIGPRTAAQMELTLSELERGMPKGLYDEIDRLFPGPGAEGAKVYMKDRAFL